MKARNKKPDSGIVYSTDPGFKLETSEEMPRTLAPGQQKLRVRLDSKQRGGKIVTVIDGFIGSVQDLEALAKSVKNHCGTGGTAKDGQVLVQGDNRDKILLWLQKNGFGHVKRS
jgi:translation initiation factor 1